MARRKRRAKPPATASRSAEAPSHEAGTDRWRPWLLGGLCALFVVRPLFPSESAASHGDGLLVVMLWIALAVFWLLSVIGNRKFRVRFGWTDAAVILLVGLHTMAALWATTRGSPRPALNMLWEWIALGLCFLLARQLITNGREARAVVAVMVGLAVALAGYGLYQYFYEMPMTKAEYIRNPDKALQEAGMWFEPGSRQRELFEMRLTESREPIATFALANSLAGYLAPWLVVTAGIGVSAGLSRKLWTTWLAVVVCALPTATCLILTKSRSAYAATALGLLLVGLFCRVRKTPLDWKLLGGIAASGAVLIAAVMAAGGLDAKVLSEASKSLGYRIQYWQSTLRMIAERPIAGCGPGNFQHAYTRYMLPEASEEIADPHNFLMEVWATAGTPALLALLAVLGCFAYAHLRRLRLSPQEGPTPGATAGQADATAHVFGGAACGFLLAIWFALISSASPGLAPVIVSSAPPAAAPLILASALAVGAVSLLWGWINRGVLPTALPVVGLVVLLVNLLAAGAMGFPGVAGSLWLLMALGLNTAETSPPRTLPRSAALGTLGILVVLAATFAATAYGPVLRCQTAMRLAQRDQRRADKHLKDAAVADPLRAEPWRQLALRAFDRWLKQRTPGAFDEFETCINKALHLAPNSAATWQMLGDRYWRAFQETGGEDTGMARKAVKAYRQAVDLYPNSALTRASLAIALRAAGEETEFQEQAALALRLDELTPHDDKKLDDPVRDELHRGLSRSSSQEN